MPRLNLARYNQWADKAARDVAAATEHGRARAARRERMARVATLSSREVAELVLNVEAK